MGSAVDKNLPAHHIERQDSRVDGPYLTDINQARAEAYVNSRVTATQSKKAKKAAAKKAAGSRGKSK